MDDKTLDLLRNGLAAFGASVLVTGLFSALDKEKDKTMKMLKAGDEHEEHPELPEHDETHMDGHE